MLTYLSWWWASVIGMMILRMSCGRSARDIPVSSEVVIAGRLTWFIWFILQKKCSNSNRWRMTNNGFKFIELASLLYHYNLYWLIACSSNRRFLSGNKSLFFLPKLYPLLQVLFLEANHNFFNVYLFQRKFQIELQPPPWKMMRRVTRSQTADERESKVLPQFYFMCTSTVTTANLRGGSLSDDSEMSFNEIVIYNQSAKRFFITDLFDDCLRDIFTRLHLYVSVSFSKSFWIYFWQILEIPKRPINYCINIKLKSNWNGT